MQEVIYMNWLVMPAIGWGAWLLLHSIAIPLVYGLGKKGCNMKRQQQSNYDQE